MSSKIKLSVMTARYHDYKDGMTNALLSWPDGTFLQGGDKGLVISHGGNYRTAYVEAFIAEGLPATGFYRGEGATIEEAEQKAWNKYQEALICINHEYESRGYTNGGGFCKHCNHFAKVFTGVDLEQFCFTCGEPTIWGQQKVVVNGKVSEEWFCEKDIKTAQEERYVFIKALKNPSRNDLFEINILEFSLGLGDYQDDLDFS